MPTTKMYRLILASIVLVFFDLGADKRAHANLASTNSLAPGVPVALIFDKKTSPDIRKLANRTINTINKGKIKFSFQTVTIDVSDDNELIQTVCSLISRGVLALFGPTHLSSIEILNSITNFYDIPYISWSPQASFKAPEVFRTKKQHVMSRGVVKRRANRDYGAEDSEYDDAVDSYDMNDIITKTNEYPELNLVRSANHTFQIYIRPDLTPAIISIIEFFEWSRIYYIYNYQQAVVNLEKLFDYQNGDRDLQSIFLLRRVVNINSCHDMLRAIEASNEKDAIFHRRKIIMIVDLDSKESYTSFLHQIKDLGMTKSKYFYLLASLGINELEVNDFRHGGADIVGFSIVDYYSVNTIKKVSELVQTGEPLNRIRPVPYDAALVVDALNYFHDVITSSIGTNMNMLFGMNDVVLKKNEIHVNKIRGVECSYSMKSTRKWPLGKYILDKLKNNNDKKNIREGLTGVISFDATGKRSDFTIGVYKVGLNTPLKRIGYYTPEKGLKIIDDKVQPDKEEHKTPVKLNRPLIVTTILEDPYLMLKSNEPGKNYTGNDRFEGYCVDLIKRIAEIVNFTYEIRPVKDGKFGVRDANGIWDGMVGELVRHEADLAVAALTISSQRERAIEFSMPFMNIGISIMIKKPEKEKPGVFSFMAPLDHMIWVCVVLAYIGVSVVLFLVSRFSPYEWHYDPKKDERGLVNDFTMLNTLWFNLAAVMQQGVDIAPRAASGRVAASAWWFFTLILISSYTANLAAFLTVERMVSPIESVEQLAGQKEIRYGAVEGGSTQEFFKNSKDDTYRRMWASMSEWGPSVFVKSTAEGVQKVRNSNGKYAFLLESSANEYLNERQNCNTIKVGDNLDSKGYGIATPIKSELRDPINLAVLQLKEEGVLEELKTKWWFDRSECGNAQGSKDSKQTPLNLINVAGIFYILIIGLFVAVFVAMCELIYKANLLAKQSNIEFKEAMKSKMRLSISGYDESIKEFREKKSISENGGPSQSPPPALPSPKI